MKPILFVLLIILMLLYLLSKGKYDDFIQPVDRKRYPLKRFFPMALYILDIVGYRYSTGYDRMLLAKIVELSGARYGRYYLQIHWANKIVFFFTGLLLTALIGAGTRVDAGFGLFSLSLLGGTLYFTDSELNEKVKKRRLGIQMDFPDFLNKLTLLVNAGMTVSRAWEKAVRDNKKESPLYEELEAALMEIRSGKSEFKAYEEFAKRCRTPEVTRVISVILQNLRKGNSELVSVLRIHSNECWEMRKNTARKFGEEASTKLLLPMMLMFIAILLIVAAPAVIAIQGI